MKKLIAILLTMALLLTFAACGGSDPEPDTGERRDRTTRLLTTATTLPKSQPPPTTHPKSNTNSST